MQYRAEIDGLRAVAVLPVILFHAGISGFEGGFVGVDIFFVISGYLISSIIMADLQAGKFSLLLFYERRARRIIPALTLITLLSVPLSWVLLEPRAMHDYAESLIGVGTFSSNIFFWRQSGYFDQAAELKPLLHTWSLSVEEQYYILFPLLLGAIWAKGYRFVFVTMAMLALVSLNLAHWASFNFPTAGFFLLPTRGWELLAGVLLALLVHNDGLRASRGPADILSIMGLLCIGCSVVYFDDTTPFPSYYALLPVVGTLLLLAYTVKGTFVYSLLANRLMVGVGLVSYSAYLWHQPLFSFLRQYRGGEEVGQGLMLLFSLLTFFLAYLSWKYVETPFRDKQKVNRKTVFAFSGFALVSLVTAGWIGLDGLLIRYPENDRSIIRQHAESGDYIGVRFNSLVDVGFVPSEKRLKVVLVGDSFAQDLVNAIYEGGMDSYFALSTHRISARCGNLYAEPEREKYWSPQDVRFCQRENSAGNSYDHPLLLQLLRDADVIWLASSWQAWQVERLRESVARLREDFGREVVVFGRKNFGRIDLDEILATAAPERALIQNEMEQFHVKINSIMSRQLVDIPFVNLSHLLCESDSHCPVIDRGGNLISPDGGHLTQPGARLLGERLKNHWLIRQMVSGDVDKLKKEPDARFSPNEKEGLMPRE